MEILARSRLTSKEQLSLPAAIRRLLGIHAGDELIWMRDSDGRLVVEPARSQSLADIRSAVAAVGGSRATKKQTSRLLPLEEPPLSGPAPGLQNRPPASVDYGCD